MEKTDKTTFEALSKILGKEGATNLCEHYGGQTLYIRKYADLGPDFNKHWHTFYGEESLEKLSRHLGGMRCYVPACPPSVLLARNTEIVRRLDNGETRRDLAKAFHLTPRTIAIVYLKHIAERGAR